MITGTIRESTVLTTFKHSEVQKLCQYILQRFFEPSSLSFYEVMVTSCLCSELRQEFSSGESCRARLSAAWFWDCHASSSATAVDQHT